MKIFPAIDLRGGRVVRLTEGDYDRMTVYGSDPVATACGFAESGVRQLHVVDLDGALAGEAVNADVIERIVKESGLAVQVGGGIRNEERIARYLNVGAKRVIMGTIAVDDPAFMLKMVQKYGDAIAVGVDAKGGRVAVNGWKTVTDKDSFEFCEFLRDAGVDCVVYTDISRDGMLCGPATDLYAALQQRFPDVEITVSGGVSAWADLETMERAGLRSAIVGKAIYEGRITLKELKRCLQNE